MSRQQGMPGLLRRPQAPRPQPASAGCAQLCSSRHCACKPHCRCGFVSIAWPRPPGRRASTHRHPAQAWPGSSQNRPPLPGPGCDVEAGYGLVLRHGLAQVHQHAAGVAQGAQPESLHQLRVGLRRVLTAWRLFAPLVAPPQALRDAVDWLFHELGPARDAQVLRDRTLPALTAAVTQTAQDSNASEDAAAWSMLKEVVAEAAAAAERRNGRRRRLGPSGWRPAHTGRQRRPDPPQGLAARRVHACPAPSAPLGKIPTAIR